MTDLPLKNLHEGAGMKSSEQTMANLVRLRMEREMDLEKIFRVLGLVRGQHTADDAVFVINELFSALDTQSDISK